MRVTAIVAALAILSLSSCAPTSTAGGTEATANGDPSIELRAYWEPLTDTLYHFDRRCAICQGWKPAVERKSYSDEDFRPFLPPAEASLGDTWALHPRDFVPFLRQIHPGATHSLHHGNGVRGAWACLRSRGPERAEVMMRVHAEFVLEGTGMPGQSSFLTPAQFEGRLVFDPRTGVVHAFRLALPDHGANVDLNILSEQGVSVDIGRIPRLELVGGEALPDAIAGADEISLAEARGRLERKFYRFAEIEWRTLEEGVVRSKATGRPLHVVMLFGALTSESC